MINKKTIFLPRGRSLAMNKAIVMGIINANQDSFYNKSRVTSLTAIDAASTMINDGADILDIGGESTRPGTNYISLDEELNRVMPVIQAIRARWDIPISVDTRKAIVAENAINNGADIINDISSMQDDDKMASVVAKASVPIIIMHKQGVPLTMQEKPRYKDCFTEVLGFLLSTATKAIDMGIKKEAIIFDPGIGFGKTAADNIGLISRLDEIAASGYPILVGLSRKSFIASYDGANNPACGPEKRLPGSLAAACFSRLKGASIFRVHDVAETVQALAVFDAINKGLQ